MWVLTQTPVRNATGQRKPILGPDPETVLRCWIGREMDAIVLRNPAYKGSTVEGLYKDADLLRNSGMCLRDGIVVALERGEVIG